MIRLAGSSPWIVTGVPAFSVRDRAPPRAACARCGRGSGARSITRRRPLGEQAGEQQARLHLGAGDRQAVLDPAQLGAADRERRQPLVARRRPRRPSAAAARRPGRPAGGGSTRRRRGSTRRSGCPASQPGSSRSRVPALPTSICRRPRAPRRPTPPDPRPRRRGRSTSRAERLDRGRASSACRRRRGSWRSRVSPSPIAATIAARCEIDLSGGGDERARAAGPAGSKRVIHSAPATTETTWPRPRTISAARARPPRRRRPRSRSRRCACRAPGRAPCPRC